MHIEYENIILRDMIESDIEDYVRWFSLEREWENWDAPWEKEDTSEETERISWRDYYESVKALPDITRRWKMEIVCNNRHIGWVSSYPIDEHYEWIDEVKDGQTVYRAVGICICEPEIWCKGIGTNALRAFINYYFENGVNELYTLVIAQAAAVVAYVPAGIVASKIGRRKTILAGIAFLSVAFFGACFLAAPCNVWLVNALFILAGIGWATINVNSYPMVVELSSSGDVGKYTGFYYTASMAAQTVTPMLSGLLLDINMRTLFPYATVFVVLAFFTMLCVRHGDGLAAEKKDKLEAFDVD